MIKGNNISGSDSVIAQFHHDGQDEYDVLLLSPGVNFINRLAQGASLVQKCIKFHHRSQQIRLTWLLGRVCTNGKFYIFVLFTTHFSKQTNLAGSSLHALLIQVSRDLQFHKQNCAKLN